MARSVPAILMLFLVGCASAGRVSARPALETLPPQSPLRVATLADGDAWLRHHLMFGEHNLALRLLDPDRGDAETDRLLRALQEALVLRDATEYERSNQLLEWADQEAERRYAPSVTRSAASLLLNDRVLSYAPAPGEMALIPYYRMINHLALQDREGAAVEARRISALLARRGRSDSYRCREDGLLHYLAGLVFEIADEPNDALVSLRQAEASFDSCEAAVAITMPAGFGADLQRVATSLGLAEVADSAGARYPAATMEAPDGSGEVLLLVERGFVAHRTASVIHVPIYDMEIDGLESANAEGIAAAAAVVTARLVGNLAERSALGSAWDDLPGVRVAHALSGAYVLRLAWPEIRTDPPSSTSVRVQVDGTTAALVPVADVSAVVARDLEDDRAAMLARLIGRGLAKYLLSREMEKKAEKQGGELLGFVAGRLANLAANETERADTRSWSLLPDHLVLGRLRLPEGLHSVRLETVSPSGELVSAMELGELRVTAGRVTVVHRRLWADPMGN